MIGNISGEHHQPFVTYSIFHKSNLMFFRKHYGIQFMLDVIQKYFTTHENLSVSDIKTVREAIYRIIKYFLLKDINIKEVNISFNF